MEDRKAYVGKTPSQERESLVSLEDLSRAMKWNFDNIMPIFTKKQMIEFADWYCNGLTNVERGTPEMMLEKWLEMEKQNNLK